eukprot:CAMPEP_0197245576 /NCGR_PEP_ID=MMETSP1429-20130617/10326_1 /TAXON_ID=49237 /ORGANISM="Chaetoceros  sp., Strain UNC1202" /LENGTH=87 /DNA_ID=CAMNT_0042706105 /DNA_START=121 /DNA_END=380 /DNA_ORIENTATION=-
MVDATEETTSTGPEASLRKSTTLSNPFAAGLVGNIIQEAQNPLSDRNDPQPRPRSLLPPFTDLMNAASLNVDAALLPNAPPVEPALA